MNLQPPCAVWGSRAEMRRRRVTDSARKLFVEHGFHATGMAQIARESGVAIGQIYRDFSSKEDVVAALVEADCGRLLMFEALDQAIRAGDRDTVRAWLRNFLEPPEDVNDLRLFAEILAEAARNDRIAAIFRTIQAQLREHLSAALALLAPGDGAAGRRAMLGDAIMTLSLGLKHQRLLQPELDGTPLVDALNAIVGREIDALHLAS